MLSQASKYAIRSVLFLAEKAGGNEKFGAKYISEELEIPYHFVAKILQKLSKEGVVSSAKGPRGGFYLTPENLQANVCRILEVVEVDKIFEPCFIGLPQCSDENPCPVHHIVAPFKEAIMNKFRNQTIAELAGEIKETGTYISLKGVDSKL